MRIPVLALLASAAVLASAASASQAATPAVCNGKHKRPANPYGSVLSVGLRPATATSPADPPVAPASAGAPAKPVAVSRAARSPSFRPCGLPA